MIECTLPWVISIATIFIILMFISWMSFNECRQGGGRNRMFTERSCAINSKWMVKTSLHIHMAIWGLF